MEKIAALTRDVRSGYAVVILAFLCKIKNIFTVLNLFDY